jgi:hypothetical protein
VRVEEEQGVWDRVPVTDPEPVGVAVALTEPVALRVAVSEGVSVRLGVGAGLTAEPDGVGVLEPEPEPLTEPVAVTDELGVPLGVPDSDEPGSAESDGDMVPEGVSVGLAVSEDVAVGAADDVGVVESVGVPVAVPDGDSPANGTPDTSTLSMRSVPPLPTAPPLTLWKVDPPGMKTLTMRQHTAALLASSGAAATKGASATDVGTHVLLAAVLSANSNQGPPARVR